MLENSITPSLPDIEDLAVSRIQGVVGVGITVAHDPLRGSGHTTVQICSDAAATPSWRALCASAALPALDYSAMANSVSPASVRILEFQLGQICCRIVDLSCKLVFFGFSAQICGDAPRLSRDNRRKNRRRHNLQWSSFYQTLTQAPVIISSPRDSPRTSR
jgi:hypothetical protein